MSETALVVMARYPEPGKTKTRLARTLGDQNTADLYYAFLRDIAHHCARLPYTVHWAYTPAERDYHALVATFAPQYADKMAFFAQEGNDFAARLHHAFKQTRQHGFSSTVLIGSDSPHIRPQTIIEAHHALEDADVVLGPAEDGGYYLIAMHEPYDVFSDIPMSTDAVLHMTIAAAEQQGLRVHLLEPLYDIDEMAELERLARLLTIDSSRAPATAEQLMRMKSGNLQKIRS